MRALTVRGWFALAAFVVLIAAVAASLFAAPYRHEVGAEAIAAPAASDLDRCRSLGADAAKDGACQAAWRRLRAHFFGAEPEAVRP